MKALIFMMAISCPLFGHGQIVETVLTHASVTDGMCTDSLGNVYTTSGGLAGYVVGKYTPSNDQFNPSFISGLVGPTDIELLNDSVLCITNYDIDAISTYNLNSGALSNITTNFDGPGGIEADDNGFIYVTNWGNAPQYAGHTITKISPSGNSWIYVDTSALYRPQAITWNHENELVVHSNSNLYKVNAADSTLVHWVSLPSGVGNIVLNKSDSCIYGASNPVGQILKITPAGDVSTFAGSTAGYVDGDISIAQFNTCLGLTFSPDESVLYISEANPHRLRRIWLQSSASVEEMNLDGSCKVYPNPILSGEKLNIENTQNKSIDHIIISNMEGKTLYAHLAQGGTSNIPARVFQNISEGVVIAQIVFMDGCSEYHKILIRK